MDLRNKIFSLPSEIIKFMSFDTKTIIYLQLEALSEEKYRDIFIILQKKAKKWKNNESDALKALKYYQIHPSHDDLKEIVLMPLTIQKKIRLLFDTEYNLEAYNLFSSIPDTYGGGFVHYIRNKYKENIFKANIELENWNKVVRYLSDVENILPGYQIIKSLPKVQQKRLRENLDDSKNLMIEFLIDSEGTDLDEWTDQVIDSWLNDISSKDLLKHIPLGYRRDFVKGVMYYVHEDPRWEQYPIKDFIENLFNKSMGKTSPFNTQINIIESDPLLIYRGPSEGYEALLLAKMREEYDSEFSGERPRENWFEQYVHGGYLFPFYAEVRYVLFQYPDLVRRYRAFIFFAESDLYNIEEIFDLFDYQIQLKPIKEAVLNLFKDQENEIETFNTTIGQKIQAFTLEELGVEI